MAKWLCPQDSSPDYQEDNIKLNKAWHLAPSLHGKQMGKQWKQRETLFWRWAPKSLQMVTAAMKLKDTCSFEEKL